MSSSGPFVSSMAPTLSFSGPPTTTPPLLTYHRCPHPATSASIPPTQDSPDSLSPSVVPPAPDSKLNNLHVALRKGTRSTRNPHPIYNFLCYGRLSPSYSVFVSSLSSVSIPKTTSEAISHPGWHQTMLDEIDALLLVPLPPVKTPFSC